MSDIDHGSWELYTPDRLLPEAPPQTLYLRRVSDGVDWYEYRDSGKSFAADTVKFTTYNRNGLLIIGAAYVDVTMLWPRDANVYETSNYTGTDPVNDLSNKVYDPDKGAISDPPPPERPIMPEDIVLLNHENRIRAIEGEPPITMETLHATMRDAVEEMLSKMRGG